METKPLLDKSATHSTIYKQRFQGSAYELIDLMITHHDITHMINLVNCYMLDPRQSHMYAIDRNLRHIKKLPCQGLWFKRKGCTHVSMYTYIIDGFGGITCHKSTIRYYVRIWKEK